MERQLFFLIIFFIAVWLIAGEFTTKKRISKFVDGLWGGA
jgi:hypothetical protein